MRTEKGTIIVEGTFREGYETWFQEYSAQIRAFLQPWGAITIRRQLIEQTLYGVEHPSLVMIIDFPDKEIARTLFFKQEYLSLIPLRDKVFKTFNMYLAAYGDV